MSHSNKNGKYALWDRENLKLRNDQVDFLYQMMCENLEHARHVENERITFNSIYIALAAGVLAFISTIDVFVVRISILILQLVLGIIAMLLTVRWNNAFSQHMDYAKQCYALIHRHLFIKDEETVAYREGAEFVDKKEALPYLEEAPTFCFGIKDPSSKKAFNKWLDDSDSKVAARIRNSVLGVNKWIVEHKYSKMKELVFKCFRTQRLFKLFYFLLEMAIVIIVIMILKGEGYL